MEDETYAVIDMKEIGETDIYSKPDLSKFKLGPTDKIIINNVVTGYKIQPVEFRLLCKEHLKTNDKLIFKDCVIMLTHRRFQHQVEFKQCSIYIITTNYGDDEATFISTNKDYPTIYYVGLYTGIFDLDQILGDKPVPKHVPKERSWFWPIF